MVRGLSVFREHFREYEQEFVLIGGAACDEWFSARDLRFRATKDLDIVLLVEGLTPSFLHHFWTFIKNGEYPPRGDLSRHSSQSDGGSSGTQACVPGHPDARSGFHGVEHPSSQDGKLDSSSL